MKSTTPGVILMNVNLDNRDGRELCKQMRQEHHLDCLILLSSANPFELKDYKAYLADGAIEKPFRLRDITSTITSFIEMG